MDSPDSEQAAAKPPVGSSDGPPDGLAVIDLSREGTAPLLGSPQPGLTWLAADLRPETCLISLDDAALAEIEALALGLAARPGPVSAGGPSALALPALRAVMDEVRARLADGPGIAVLDTLPLEALDHESATAVFWCLGQMLGQAVAQKWDGTLLYEVADSGESYRYGVRGSWTNVELVFHTDNAFGVAPPDTVGLLCLRPAREGGTSRFCSLYSLHDRLQTADPAALARLYRPMLWDRQAEHAPGDPKVAWAPMFALRDGRLAVRANVSLVRKGYALAGQAPDAALETALAAIEAVTADPALWFELPLERGQIQYLNNREIAHYRSAFSDDPDPAAKRRLIRTWHRDRGGPGYDG